MIGIYPIQYAILFGNIKVIETLIANGASPEIRIEGIPFLHLSLSFSSNIII